MSKISSKIIIPPKLSKDKVRVQLNRISGQIDGVIKMYDDERVCVDIVRQIVAVRNSLGTVARDLLTGEVVRCSREQKTQDLDKVLKEVFR